MVHSPPIFFSASSACSSRYNFPVLAFSDARNVCVATSPPTTNPARLAIFVTRYSNTICFCVTGTHTASGTATSSHVITNIKNELTNATNIFMAHPVTRRVGGSHPPLNRFRYLTFIPAKTPNSQSPKGTTVT